MFSVHGITGQVFRGPLEQLNQVPGVLAARHARGVAREGGESGAEFRIPARPSGEEAEKTHQAAAAAAYANMQHRDSERDPVRYAWQIMGREVLTLHPADTVAAAWRALANRRVRQAPVLEPGGRVIGLAGERDLLTVLDLQGGQVTGSLERQVGEVMRTPVICADPLTDVRRIARVLLDTGLSALPVVSESGELAGVVSRGDILRAAVADPPLSLWI